MPSLSGKNFYDLLDRIGELLNLLTRIVKSKACTSRGRNVKKLHYRLSTVVAGTDRDPLLIEDRADVVLYFYVQRFITAKKFDYVISPNRTGYEYLFKPRK